MELAICIFCSIVVSILTTKILATHYFKIVNGYVDDMCNKTNEFVEITRTRMLNQGTPEWVENVIDEYLANSEKDNCL